MKTKKRILKKWLENVLIFENCLIFCLVASIGEYTDIFRLLAWLGGLGLIFYFNYKIIVKYGRK